VGVRCGHCEGHVGELWCGYRVTGRVVPIIRSAIEYQLSAML